MLDQIASFIQGHDLFAISTHISPEGDALGSALAVRLALKRLGKQTRVVLRDPIPANLDFLPGAERVLTPNRLHDEDFEHVIVVDCGAARRIGDDLYERFKGRYLINIDHHHDNPRFGNLHHVRERASATMVVAELLDALDVPLDAELATCLYAGLLADTNAFCNANVDASVLETAAAWVRAGADPHRIVQQMNERQTWKEFQFMAQALSQARLEDGIVWIALPLAALSQLDSRHQDTDGIVTRLRGVDGAQVTALFKEIEPRKVKVSLRAKGRVPVNEIARHFGGGGHVKAAGCLVEGSLDEVTQAVLARIRERVLSDAVR